MTENIEESYVEGVYFYRDVLGDWIIHPDSESPWDSIRDYDAARKLISEEFPNIPIYDAYHPRTPHDQRWSARRRPSISDDKYVLDWGSAVSKFARALSVKGNLVSSSTPEVPGES